MKRLTVLTITIVAFAAMLLPTTAFAGAPATGKTIALDAGHGGEDPGAVNAKPEHQLFEKDMDRAVADVLKEKLEKDGAKVVMVRPHDETVGLNERAAAINASGANISISLHHNSAAPDVNGTETYFADAADQVLAAAINKKLGEGLGIPNRGVKQETGFVLTRVPTMPSIISEASFVTNDAEAQAFKSGDRVQVESDLLHQGINDYFAG